jgi:hypothetical protein
MLHVVQSSPNRSSADAYPVPDVVSMLVIHALRLLYCLTASIMLLLLCVYYPVPAGW